MTKNYLTYQDIEALVKRLITEIEASGWEPEIVVGVARGGLLPAVMLSHHFDCPMQPLVWSRNRPGEQESNCWLSEDASAGKHTLIIDDIVDTGATIEEIMNDWDLTVVANIDWGKTVKVGCLQKRDTSKYDPAYVGELITNTQWQVYPWEELKHVSK